MDETRIVLAGLWVALMLTYLLGDVLRILAGDMEPGKLAGGTQATPATTSSSSSASSSTV